MMKLVYVAGPFSGPTRDHVDANIVRAESLGVDVAAAGAMPVTPHANTANPRFEVVQGYEFWIEGTLELLRRCDALILTTDWESSRGARGEELEALRMGIPVLRDCDALRRWLQVTP